MKNFLYSISMFIVIFAVCYPQVLGIYSLLLINLLIIIFWSILILFNRAYAILFCFLGYIHPFSGNVPGYIEDGINVSILFIILLVISSLILNIQSVFINKNIEIVKYIWIFTLYQLLISILPNLGSGSLSFSVLLMEKDQIFGLLLFFPGYYIGTKHYKTVIIFLTYFGFFFTIFYLLMLFQIFSFIVLQKSYVISAVEQTMRYGIDIRQIVKIFIYAFPLAFLFKFKDRYIILATGLLCYLFILLSFARNELVYSTIGILLTVIFISRFKLKNISFAMGIIIFSTIIISYGLLIFTTLLPAFDFMSAINLSRDASQDSQSFFTFSHRFNTILPNQMNLLFSSAKNLFLGVGYNDYLRENALTKFDLGIWDVPVTGTMTKFGLIGFTIYMTIYLNIFKEISKFYYLLKRKQKYLLLNENFEEYLFSIALMSYFLTYMIFRTFYITHELTVPVLMVEFAFILGIFIASVENIIRNEFKVL